MRTSVRTGVALSVSGLAVSGFALLGGPAEASAARTATASAATTTAAAGATEAGRICRYKVRGRHGARVYRWPGGRVVGHLHRGKVVYARCHGSHGWNQLFGKVRHRLRYKFVHQSRLVRF
ncbi:hypothetical protein [Actinomadura macrotermitis]|uniref:SH3 domain-containing protein n=1 Tax=Actinomadura macrotermitis TaxID=2585200 RepID=A0A7K0BPA7_9ACTN|nr:hypothetical protein [Actinomadura macrotermitis]MQY02916.1 hypothetical protein [Actinomadura macrotermitis]